MLREVIARVHHTVFVLVLKGAIGNGFRTWNVSEVCSEAIPGKDRVYGLGKVSFSWDSLGQFGQRNFERTSEEVHDEWIECVKRPEWLKGVIW